MKNEWKKLISLVGIFALFYFLPLEKTIIQDALWQGVLMLQDYARKHVLLCLIPAFFIAGGITVYARKEAVLKLLGAQTSKWISYPVASLSGGILAVCSCTILPLFAGIWKRGAGIGPATAFLYAGPAINIAAIFLTGTVLGWEMSFVRLFFSLIGALLIGFVMQALFEEKHGNGGIFIQQEERRFSTWAIAAFFLLQLAFLITGGLTIHLGLKTILMVSYFIALIVIVFTQFDREHNVSWIQETWDFTQKILPFLLGGVFIAGIITKALPEEIVHRLLGGNRLFSNLFASVFGALMYFATLTEVPIIQSLMQLGMGKGPALALFLAGYSLSLPNMIVLARLLGAKRAFTYIVLIILYSTAAGFIYGNYLFV